MKALAFDMDGVIIDSESFIVEIEQLVCQRYGLRVPDHEWEHFRGQTSEFIFSYIVTKYGRSALDVDQLVLAKRQLYLDLAADRLRPIAGSLEFLAWVRQRYDKLSLTTMSSRAIQVKVFEVFGLEPLFDVVVNGDQVAHSKPHPESYQLTFERLGGLPDYVVEDSDNGIYAAKAAGARVLGLTTSFSADKLLACGADGVIASFDELRGLIEA